MDRAAAPGELLPAPADQPPPIDLLLFRQLPSACLLLRPDLTIADATDRYLAATLTEREAIVGRPLFEAFPDDPDDPTADGVRNLRSSLERVLATRTMDVMPLQRYAIRGPAGAFEERWWSPRNAPVIDPAGVLVAIVHEVQDVTARRRAEEALEGARLQAERASQAKSEFLSRMSHELRTPLNAILGFAQLLEADEDRPDQLMSIGHILLAGRHLLELINEVLDLSRIEAGRISLETEGVEVATLLEEAAALILPLASAREIRVTVEATPEVYALADRQRLRQVLMNLLANAVKYNRDGGSTVLRLVHADAEVVRLEVSDTGPGIAPARLGQLFTPFERLGQERSEVEGTGIGLALSKGLVEAMNGAIWVESTPGVGTTIWLEVPAGPPAASDPTGRRPATGARTPGGEREVLVVEDNATNRRLFERILERRPGLRVRCVDSGKEALRAAAAEPPDLVILDLHLPDLDGEVVLAHLRGDPATAGCQVIIVSADATAATIERLERSGVARYLTKPIGIPELLEAVERALSADGRRP